MKKDDKKKQTGKKMMLLSGAMFFVFGLMVVFSVVGLSNSVTEIANNTISLTPDAILASAGVEEGGNVSLPVTYFDQKADECVNMYDMNQKSALKSRQFEWTSCDYRMKSIESGLVDFYLGEDYLPVVHSGKMLANRGLSDTTRWYQTIEGKSQEYSGTLNLDYSQNGAIFSYLSEAFYPLDGVEFSKGDVVNKDGHNHLFTMNFAVPFTALFSGEENFEIEADDDTFVFLGDKLVVDMGGIHDATTGKFRINGDGEVFSGVDSEEMAYSGVKLNKDDSSVIRIFHADRDADGSVFKLKISGMNLNVVNTKLANSGNGGVQIAYDPSNPSYIAPLGESLEVKPNGTKGYIIMTMVFGVMIVVFAMGMVVLARYMLRKRFDR